MTSFQTTIPLPTFSIFATEPIIKGRRKIGFLQRNGFAINCSIKKLSSLDLGFFRKDGILMRKAKRKGTNLFVVSANKGPGSNLGGWEKAFTDKRLLGNIALAVGFTYLSITGQLGWVLDTIVSIWLLAVLLPVVGLGVFIWYAGRDVVQSSCPNCGNDFQILKSLMNDGVQLCPFCAQPFSVQGNKFVRESANFSSGPSKRPDQVFNGFSRNSGKGEASSAAVVDIEAEVKDIE